MKIDIPARIRRMSRRRQKVAIRHWLEKDLQRFVGQPNSPLVRAEVTKIMMGKLGIGIHAEVVIQPRTPVEKIDLNFVVTNAGITSEGGAA